MTGRDKFAETKLPPIEMFHNTLKEEKLDDEDYRRAQEIWSKFNIENMQQYHDHYLIRCAIACRVPTSSKIFEFR